MSGLPAPLFEDSFFNGEPLYQMPQLLSAFNQRAHVHKTICAICMNDSEHHLYVHVWDITFVLAAVDCISAAGSLSFI